MGESRLAEGSVPSFFRNLKIRTRLTIAFLALSLIPLSAVTLTLYTKSKQAIKQEVLNNLHAITTRQSNEIENYFLERELNVTALAKDPTIQEALVKFTETFAKEGTKSPDYLAAEKKVTPFLNYYLEASGFQNLYLISGNGDIVFSLKNGTDFGTNVLTGPYQETDLARVFRRAVTLLETDISDFRTYQASNEPAAFIGAPVFKTDGLLGALVFQLNNSEMFKVVNDYAGLGKSGETVVVSKVGNQGVFMAPTRFDPNAALARRFDLNDSEDTFLQSVLKGNPAVGITTDYRDQEVLAVGKFFLPSLQWGMMVKMDTDELFAPLKTLQWLLIIVMVITAIFVLLAAFFVARSITNPINMLIDKTHKMAEGNLSERILVTSTNEIGLLSTSFNSMSEQLDHLIKNLDHLVQTRTKEVEEKNSKLEESLVQVQSMQKQIIVQEKLASLGQLTAGIAHEIKNPLNFVNNFAHLCEKQIAKIRELLNTTLDRLSPEEKTAFTKSVTIIEGNVQKIYQYGERADSILKNMLAHSRAGTGTTFQATAINSLLEENFKLVYHAKRAEDSTFNIQMQMKFDENLGEVDILPQEFSRVIINLLNNSFYAVNKKKKELGESFFPIVTITTKNLGPDKVFISIHDNGTGIPNSVLEKLYTPFFTSKPPGEGTGLGLSLSREVIVAAHHGEMSVETKEGEFTSFAITLPRKQTGK